MPRSSRTAAPAPARSEAPQAGLYRRITGEIVAALARGVLPWRQPWRQGLPAVARPRRANGAPYRGINVLVLWNAALARGYGATVWMTCRQAQALGAHIRRGETGTRVVYVGRLRRTQPNGMGNDVDVWIPFLREYAVFNAEQIAGLPAEAYTPPAAPPEPERIARAEAYFAHIPAEVRHGGSRACYALDQDLIELPPFAAFRDAAAYYATRGHETLHWTRHPTRLARDFGRRRWGDAGYAVEELVAELGACFLAADLGLTPDHWDNHAAYIGSWLAVLDHDPRAVFTAAARAEQAVAFLAAFQPGLA